MPELLTTLSHVSFPLFDIFATWSIFHLPGEENSDQGHICRGRDWFADD